MGHSSDPVFGLARGIQIETPEDHCRGMNCAIRVRLRGRRNEVDLDRQASLIPSFTESGRIRDYLFAHVVGGFNRSRSACRVGVWPE